MKPLSERDENSLETLETLDFKFLVGMKPLSERDENNTNLDNLAIWCFLL